LPLDLGKQMEMNHTSISTLVRSLPETGLWVNVNICCLGITLFGSQTVALLDFFSHTTAAIRQSSISKCVLWDGTLTSSIRQTTT